MKENRWSIRTTEWYPRDKKKGSAEGSYEMGTQLINVLGQHGTIAEDRDGSVAT